MIDLRTTAPNHQPDVYFGEGYGRLDASFRNGEWATLANPDGSWQMPVVITGPLTAREALSPYGYAGIHTSDACLPEESEVCWRQATDLLADAGTVSLFLRFSPFDERSSSMAALLPGLAMVRSGETYLNAIGTPDEMWTSMEGRARTAVRKARSSGMSARVRSISSTELLGGSTFRQLYEETMRRVHAGEQYFFGDEYYRALSTIKGSPLFLAEVLLGDDVVAASLIIRHAHRAHYHLSGSNLEAARLGANALLVWSMLEWCSEMELDQCHLGGGLTAGDGLAKFKRSFGGRVVDFFTGRAVINQPEYERLTAERARILDISPERLASTEYFPAFRAGA